MISTDGVLLQQVLHNMISNAIKYNVDNGWIPLSAKGWARQVEIIMTNASTGIEPFLRGRIFERFYRADSAHSRKIEGVGLGLGLSREIARAHGGDLTFSINPDNTVCFSLMLPREGQ